MASKLLTAALVLACVAGAAAQSLKTDITSFRNNDPVTVTVTNPSPGTKRRRGIVLCRRATRHRQAAQGEPKPYIPFVFRCRGKRQMQVSASSQGAARAAVLCIYPRKCICKIAAAGNVRRESSVQYKWTTNIKGYSTSGTGTLR